MAITRIQQSQVSGSLAHSSVEVTGSDLIGQSSLNADLDVLRSLIKDMKGSSGNWYDAASQDLAEIYGAFQASGANSMLMGDAAVVGSITGSSSLTIAGPSGLVGAVTAGSTVTAAGLVTANNGLTVNNAAADFNAGVTANVIAIDGDSSNIGGFYIVGGSGEIADSSAMSLVGGHLSLTGSAGFTSYVNVGGALSVSGAGLFASDVAVVGDLTGSSGLLVQGAADLDGALDVAGAVSLQSTLAVAGAADLDGALDVQGAVNLQDALTVAGAADFNSSADFQGAVNLQDALTVAGAADFNSTSDFQGAMNLQAGITVAGAADFNSTSDFQGAMNLQAGITVAGTADLNGALEVAGTSTLSGAVTAGSTLAVVGQAMLSGGAIAANLDVAGTGSFAGAVTMGSTLGVTGAATFSSTLQAGASTLASVTVPGAADFNGGVAANEIKIDGDTAQRLYIVGASGEIKDEAALTYDGSQLKVDGGMWVTGNAQVDGDLLVKGAMTYIETSNLKVADAFIHLATGSAGSDDKGLVFHSGGGADDLIIGQNANDQQFVFAHANVESNVDSDNAIELAGVELAGAWLNSISLGGVQGSLSGTLAASASGIALSSQAGIGISSVGSILAVASQDLWIGSNGNNAILWASGSQAPSGFDSSSIVGMLNELRSDLDAASAGGNLTKQAYSGSSVSANALDFSGQVTLSSADYKLVDVFLNGVLMAPGYDLTAITTTSVTFDASIASSLIADDVIVVVSRG